MRFGKQKQMLEAGQRAPDFRLRDLNHDFKSLDEILSRGPALVAFFKVSCPTCQLTFPFLERIHRGAKESSVQLVAISQDDADRTREFNLEYGVTCSTLLDEDSKGYPVSNAFGISHVPSLFLLERDRAVAWTLDGFSKGDLEALGRRVGVSPFRPDEDVPEWKSG